MRICFAAAVVLLIAVSPRPASATAFQPGDVVVYNYDFLGGPFPPPYDQLTLVYNLANVAPGAVASFAFFDGLDATGGLFLGSSGPLPPALMTFNSFGFGAAVDGQFSVRITANNLPFEILSTTATAFGSPTGAPLFTITGTIAPAASVPEPASVALVGAGLGVRLMRRRRRRS
jgi:hypothetical protein